MNHYSSLREGLNFILLQFVTNIASFGRKNKSPMLRKVTEGK